MSNTHLDGLTHVGLDGRWHSGRPSSDCPADMLVGAATGSATRAICLDVTAVRGTSWAGPDPVGGTELDAAAAGTGLLPGDAVLIYMGRDAFEADG